MAYSHEFRPRNTDALLAGVKDDLKYLANLPKNHPIIKKHGKVNIDKNYVHPKTEYRSRKKMKKRTIRKVLDQEKITRVEAMGVHRHFPNAVDTRIEINRELSQEYSKRDEEIAKEHGSGRHWYDIIQGMKPLFEKVKGDLAKDFKKTRKVVHEPDLIRDEYLAVKGFLKRCSIGKDNDERNNYLRNYTVEEFQKTAPIVVAVGRKVRYADKKSKETKNSSQKHDIIRQECMLKEDFEDMFEQLTGIEESPDKTIDRIVNAQLVKNETFQNFQKENGKLIGEAYEHGLIAKKYLKRDLKRNHERLQKEDVVELDEKTKERFEKIKECAALFHKYFQSFLSILLIIQFCQIHLCSILNYGNLGLKSHQLI